MTAATREGQSGRICLVVAYHDEGEALSRTLATVRLRAGDSIIVVDDGSQRLPAREFCPEQVDGVPVTLVELSVNEGVAAAAIAGVSAADPDIEYIARLDCRDRSTLDRFDRQRAYLDRHATCSIVGSAVIFCDPTGAELYRHSHPESDRAIRSAMRVNCAFTQPAVMFRHDAYVSVGGYSEKYPWAEDYALFRSLLTVGEGHNLADPLVYCSTMDGGISQRHRRRQLMTRMKIIVHNWDWHPLSFWGLARATGQLATSRNFTSRVKRMLGRSDRGNPSA